MTGTHERYQGELDDLRHLLSQVRSAADQGDAFARRAIAEFTRRELPARYRSTDREAQWDVRDAAPIGRSTVPKIGQVCIVTGTAGTLARVVDDRIWQKRIGVYASPERFALIPLVNDSAEPRGLLGTFTFGRLVLTTTGGGVAPHQREIRALRSFEIPVIPGDERGNDQFWALLEVEERARKAGLILTVRRSKHLEVVSAP